MDYLREIKEFHSREIELYTGKAVGCSENEIKEIELKIGYDLPEAYRQYLQWMGKDYKGVFVGCDWFITDITDNNELLAELLIKNQVDYKLAKHYLAFFSHQGYMVAWFDLPKESENPTVYFFTESRESLAVKTEEKFTDFLFNDMQGMASFLSQTRSEK